jgi:signal transduction histidine kinase/DNA-binding NarL/FixJ family response regulator
MGVGPDAPRAAPLETRGAPGVRAGVPDPFPKGGGRFPRSAWVLVGVWVLLAGGLCYLIATAVPGKPVPLAAAALILVALGALLGSVVVTERRAGNRQLDAVLVKASNTLRSMEAVTDPGLAFLDLDELLEEVLDRAMAAIGGDAVCMLLASEDGTTLRVRACAGKMQYAPVGGEVTIGEGVLGTVAQWARPVVVADVRNSEERLLPGSAEGISSLAAAPMIVHGTTLGLVEVASVEQRTFDPADLRLLQVVADRLAGLVERARLDEVARRSRLSAEHANNHLRILERSGKVLGRALESYNTALGDLGDVVVPDFADWFGVHILEETGRLRRIVTRSRSRRLGGHAFKRAGNPHPQGDELVRLAMTDRRPQMLVPTMRLDTESLGAAIHTPETMGEWPDVGSMLVIPVRVRGAFMAALSFATGPERRGYRPSDLETGKELADRVGVTIERVLSWRASERAGDLAFQYAKRLRRLVDASLVMNEQFSQDEMLALLVEHAHHALDADVTVVSAAPSGGPLVEKVWPSDRGGSQGTSQGGVTGDIAAVVAAASDAVSRSAEVVRMPDEWTGARAGETPSAIPSSSATAAAAVRVRGWIAAPITDADGRVRRVVVAAGAPGTQFNFEDESVLTLLAQMSSVALRNAALYAEVVGNEQRLQTLVDSSPLAIAELRPTGEAQWWNRAAEELFGWPDGSVPRRIPVRPGSELVLAGLLESSFAGKPIIGVALPVTGTGDEPLELSVSSSPVGHPGSVSGLLVVAEDVTERQRMLEQFHQAERLNAMSRMAGAVAHDFNNLLTVILGCSDVLMRRLSEDEDLAPDVAAIQRAGTRAAALTNQLVRIGGQEHPVQPELVDVDEAVSSMQSMLQGVLGERVRLRLVAGGNGAAVLVDRSELERSILNLAINARDAMPEGGTFTIETERAGRLRASGEELMALLFADTGIGMDETTAAHCFEPFFTTKGRARGTGLGLAAVHAMVLRADGDIQVDTSPGGGARFTITLPVAEGAGPLASAEARRDAPGAEPFTQGGGGETLLVVDDEPEVLRLEVRELQSVGYDVVGASNASEALHVLNSRAGAVDLLVTDVVMPGMNGIELATAVRWRYPGVAVLFVSGHLDDDATVRGPLPAEASFLTKPFGPDELTRRVREVLGHARATTRSTAVSAERGPKGKAVEAAAEPAAPLQGSNL